MLDRGRCRGARRRHRQLLDRPRKRGWRLYQKHGVERQELTRELLVGVARKSIHFKRGLREEDAMRKALLALNRDVREDGPGSELCVALIALADRPRPKPRVY